MNSQEITPEGVRFLSWIAALVAGAIWQSWVLVSVGFLSDGFERSEIWAGLGVLYLAPLVVGLATGVCCYMFLMVINFGSPKWE